MYFHFSKWVLGRCVPCVVAVGILSLRYRRLMELLQQGRQPFDMRLAAFPSSARLCHYIAAYRLLISCFGCTRLILSYQPLSLFPGWSGAAAFLEPLIEEFGCRRVLEAGAGANPTLSPAYVRDHGISCITSDIDAHELEKADSVFDRLVIDLSSSIRPDLMGQFDCVFSRMVGEHVCDGRQFHQNMYDLLTPGGISVHCLSTLWCLPFAANMLLPEVLSRHLLSTFSPRQDGHKHGKFPARYSWGRGPTKKMISRFEDLGFEIVNYTGYFGHPYYVHRLPLLHRAEVLKARLLLRWPTPHLCSYATIVLRKL